MSAEPMRGVFPILVTPFAKDGQIDESSLRRLIEFNLAEAAAARLVVFDINGRTVRTLVSEVRAAGHHAVRWDGRDSDGVPVASGVYFYRLETSGYEQTRRMVLLR